jgi:hypothetical protein
MTPARYFAYTAFSAYVAFGPGIYMSGKTQVNGLGYVRYENFPSKQLIPVYQLLEASTQIDSGSAAAFIFLTNSL